LRYNIENAYDDHKYKILMALIALVVVVFLFMNKSKGSSGFPMIPLGPSSGSGNWYIYGTDRCGWTIKMKAYFERKSTGYIYVNCESSNGRTKCNELNITGYPVVVSPTGTITRGYREDIL